MLFSSLFDGFPSLLSGFRLGAAVVVVPVNRPFEDEERKMQKVPGALELKPSCNPHVLIDFS